MVVNSEYQTLAFRKNEHYRDAYRRLLKWLVLLSTVALVLTVMLFWMTLHRSQPAYYASVTNGEVVPIHSLSEPVITNQFIVQWSAMTAKNLYNLDFNNYSQALDGLKNRFTAGGWNKLQAVLKSTGFIKNVTDNKLTVDSVVSGEPVILTHMSVNGRYTWRVQMKLLVKYTSASAVSQQNLLVTMDVERVPSLDASQGVQVSAFEARGIV